MPNFTPGQTVYSEDGYAYEYCGEISGYSFVRDVYEDDFEGYTDHKPRAHRGPLFEKAPRQKRDEEMAAAQERLKAVRDEEYALRRSIADLKAEEEAAAARHSSFALLLDYLDGKITHVVVPRSYQSGMKILPFDETFLMKAERERYYSSHEETWPRAIGLFSVPNPCEGKGTKYDRRKITWKAADYNSGGDTWTQFTPCRSEEEAKAFISARVEKALETWRKDGKGAGKVQELVLGNDWLTLPQDWLDHEKAQAEQIAAGKRVKLERERAKLEAELAALSSEAAGV